MHKKYSFITKQLASKLAVTSTEIENAITLIEKNYAVPFISKCCKEKIGSLSTRDLRNIEKVVIELHEVETRRAAIIDCIRSQDKLSAELQHTINNAKSKQTLEDIYLPYRPQRMTKAIIAKQKGLEQLAKELLSSTANPEELATKYVNTQHEIINAEVALEGARQIIMENFAENPNLLQIVREYFWQNGFLHSTNANARKNKQKKYTDYRNFVQAIKEVSEQQLITIFAGRTESYLKINLSLPENLNYGTNKLVEFFKIDQNAVIKSAWLRKVIADTWTLKLFPKVEVETLNKLRDIASAALIKATIDHFRQLLFIPPAGQKTVMGLIPNSKTTVALAIISTDGTLIEHCMLNPIGIQGDWHQSLAHIAKLIIKHGVCLISIANTPGFREIERLIRELINTYPDITLAYNKIDSYGLLEFAEGKTAKTEFPNIASLPRAAISLARRSQDHLAEIAKMDLNTLPLSQYSFCKNKLEKALQLTLQDCICAIGVNLNTASWHVLRHIPGLNSDLAKQIVNHRTNNGYFKNLTELEELCAKNELQQAVNFLYITKNENYRDSRGDFRLPKINQQINLLKDLQQGLELEGVVSKITNYGVFVDIGIYQEGFIRKTTLADETTSKLKLGTVVKVQVIDINKTKKRFNLTLKNNNLSTLKPNSKPHKVSERIDKHKTKPKFTNNKLVFNAAMADALAKLRKGDER